ncbi:MAG: GNAT family N-acetyltransferase [Planctomycetaceae bacterium]
MTHSQHRIELPISQEDFRRLPQHPGYRYDYFNGTVVITPASSEHHAVLQLDSVQSDHVRNRNPIELTIQPLTSAGFDELADLFAASAGSLPAFHGLSGDQLRQASENRLRRTLSGGDGQLLVNAGFVAVDDGNEQLLGAVMITSEWEPGVPAHRPHLTWIFVSPTALRRGIATTLLSSSIQSLKKDGHSMLLSTFDSGNVPSLLWHWKNGFRLTRAAPAPHQS